MLKLMEINPLPEVCRKCEEQCKIYAAQFGATVG